ncbi:MAG: ADP-ribosylglycohydrolase [bacterium]|jgi:ADP-ribosylglycohydrolase
MLGSIAGDVIGSIYELRRNQTKKVDFPLFHEKSCFTDDTILTIAIAKSILMNIPYVDTIKELGRKYPKAGYGGFFKKWLFSNSIEGYGSYGNGSAMRVSPIGFAFDDIDTVLLEAKKSAEVTHNHPEGIKGAQAIALAILLARQKKSKSEIQAEIETRFHYDLKRKIDDIRPDYYFDSSCQGSVPESIIAFLESTDVESAIRLAVSIGGDADTQACMAGGIAQAYYGKIPKMIVDPVKKSLTPDLLEILTAFEKKFSLVYS